MYCAIIGDIIDSKSISDRSRTQEKLKSVLGMLNKNHSQQIEAGFTVTLGDEFQGLLKSPENVLEMVDEVRDRLYPVRVRIGIGLGEMTTSVNPSHAIGADGPAFYGAREAIKAVKETEGHYGQPYADVWIGSYDEAFGGYKSLDTVNALLSTTGYIESKWTDKQREILYWLRTTDLSQRAIAEKCGLGQSSVQRRISSSGYYTYRAGRKAAAEVLMAEWEAMNHE